MRTTGTCRELARVFQVAAEDQERGDSGEGEGGGLFGREWKNVNGVFASAGRGRVGGCLGAGLAAWWAACCRLLIPGEVCRVRWGRFLRSRSG